MTTINKIKAFKLAQLKNRKGEPRCVITKNQFGQTVLNRVSKASRKINRSIPVLG